MGNGLSFSVTPEEEQRAALVKTMTGMDVDPRGRADAIMIVVLSTGYCFNVLAVLYSIYKRNYPPLKCKTPLLMAGVVLCSGLWFVGDLQLNGHVPLSGTPLTNCKLFGVWVDLVLGLYALTGLAILRTYGLVRVFRLNRPFRGWGVLLPSAVYYACVLVLGIVIQAMPPAKAIYYMPGADVCNAGRKFMAAVFALIWVAWGVVFALCLQLRGIKSSFHETRDNAVGCVVVLVILIWATFAHFGVEMFVFTAKYRILTTVLNHLGSWTYWWLVMGNTVVNCLFREEAYLREWTAKLCMDGMELKYDVSTLRGTSHDATAVERPSIALLTKYDADPTNQHYETLSHDRLNMSIPPPLAMRLCDDGISWPQLRDFRQPPPSRPARPDKKRVRFW
ncbi:hypothetical protein H4R18_002854 [Coemansia javaensis]|uniref:Uncharacterized protein n=1 Tax=Coemansia javaensis TaxID=2761396 RepID=A0A9W8HDW1_9FUNG|nr:hypothetical protein H4R18_002854 [Coemansia javaensis]